jgi:hypothetical protein
MSEPESSKLIDADLNATGTNAAQAPTNLTLAPAAVLPL